MQHKLCIISLQYARPCTVTSIYVCMMLILLFICMAGWDPIFPPWLTHMNAELAPVHACVREQTYENPVRGSGYL